MSATRKVGAEANSTCPIPATTRKAVTVRRGPKASVRTPATGCIRAKGHKYSEVRSPSSAAFRTNAARKSGMATAGARRVKKASSPLTKSSPRHTQRYVSVRRIRAGVRSCGSAGVTDRSGWWRVSPPELARSRHPRGHRGSGDGERGDGKRDLITAGDVEEPASEERPDEASESAPALGGPENDSQMPSREEVGRDGRQQGNAHTEAHAGHHVAEQEQEVFGAVEPAETADASDPDGRAEREHPLPAPPIGEGAADHVPRDRTRATQSKHPPERGGAEAAVERVSDLVRRDDLVSDHSEPPHREHRPERDAAERHAQCPVASGSRRPIDRHLAPTLDVLAWVTIEEGGERDGHDGHEEAEDRQRRAPAEDDGSGTYSAGRR